MNYGIRYTLWKQGNVVQLNFASIGCRFKKSGYCSVCNYGRSDFNVNSREAGDIIISVLDQYAYLAGEDLELVLGTSGSIFDVSEMSRDVLETILDCLGRQSLFKKITFETHCAFVNQGLLDLIKFKLPGKILSIEMGLESANLDVLHNYYKKNLSLGVLQLVIDQIKRSGIQVGLNIMLGAPGLNSYQRVQDAYVSVIKAFDWGADWVVIFPVNIKPDTELYDMYKAGQYNLVMRSEVSELKMKIPKEYLGRISWSWTGERQKSIDARLYGWDKIIAPDL